MAHTTHLELVHNWHNLILQSLVRDLAAAKVDLIANKDDGNIDAELAEVWEPVCRYAVEGEGIVDCIDYADDMRLADFALEVRAVRGAGACVDDVRCYVLGRDLRWYGDLGNDVLDLRGRSAAAATRPCARAHMRDEGLLDERGDDGALADAL